MKNTLLILILLFSNFYFSQFENKSITVKDSVNAKYPSRNQEVSSIIEIYSLSQKSKEEVNKKVKNNVSKFQLKDLTKAYVDNVINYYQMNYVWLFTDKIFSNFNKGEIVTLKKLIKKNKSDSLIEKFLKIEQDCINEFDKKFE